LRAGGVRGARKRVARLRRAAGLGGCHRRRRARTTVADPTHAPAPHLVARDCAAPAPDRRWRGASTDVATHEGGRSLAVRLDAHARRVVGRALADRVRAALAGDALTMALPARRPPPGLVHHTDRGGPYPAAAARAVLAARGVAVARSRRGDGYDNAMAESFVATRTADLLAARAWPTRTAARTASFAWLASGSNRQRRHSARNDQPPVAFEEAVVWLSRVAA
jgi:transposase InsO family protein